MQNEINEIKIAYTYCLSQNSYIQSGKKNAHSYSAAPADDFLPCERSSFLPAYLAFFFFHWANCDGTFWLFGPVAPLSLVYLFNPQRRFPLRQRLCKIITQQ